VEEFAKAANQLADLYRDFDRMTRPGIKIRMEEIYETMKQLGAKLGVPCRPLDPPLSR
jgi:hypothetical protein